VEFVLERSSSKTQSISVAMERWSVEHRAFVVETYFKNNEGHDTNGDVGHGGAEGQLCTACFCSNK
jgi:hypothetical protein